MGRGIHRGFITHEELNKSLGKRNLSSDNLEQAFIHILEEKIVFGFANINKTFVYNSIWLNLYSIFFLVASLLVS